MHRYVIFLLLGVFVGQVLSYPNEVPATDSVCRTMTPGHGPRPKDGPSVYKITPQVTSVPHDGILEVELKGEKDFRGFYVQARNANGEPIGTFIPKDANTKVHNCFGGKNNGIFHGSRGTRNNVVVSWKPPKDYSGNVNFVATFVQDFDNFWTNVNGGSVAVA